ncbi:hypothetical protein NDU88_003841 [Pleurodeles waltl]|uniref:Uncharacterized protein n=1 Tax=Pleurodeles waltl TaxID=8319 RepID=A0AAV7MRS0_PLEWA|nr:hypothetical protein NDU88_003841 [Pleurodeles waltl]
MMKPGWRQTTSEGADHEPRVPFLAYWEADLGRRTEGSLQLSQPVADGEGQEGTVVDELRPPAEVEASRTLE